MLCLKLVVALCAVLSAASANFTKVPLKRLTHQYLDTQYGGEAVIGSQTFLLVFDTSSPNVIVPSQECMGGSCSCITVQKYVGSSGNADPITVTFFDSSQATGRPIHESLTIVDLTSPNQGIIVADTLDMAVCQLGASGVVGLAPPRARTSPDLNTVMCNFARLGLIFYVFSIHHQRFSDGFHFGELIIGGSDYVFVDGNFTKVHLVEETSWKFKLDQVLVGSVNVATNYTLGFIDTSKSVILGPKAQIDQINAQIGCTQTQINSETNLCTIPCGATGLPIVTFVINYTNFPITPEVYVQKRGSLCYSGFVPTASDCYMIGDLFIDQYYCEFNWKERVMRFAKAKEQTS